MMADQHHRTATHTMLNKGRLHFFDALRVWPQYCIPQHILTRLVYRLSRTKIRWLKNVLIRQFIRYFDVDLSVAEISDAKGYSSFNAFFTRRICVDARPIVADAQAVLCPVDGRVNQCGAIADDHLLQAKGKSFTLSAFLTDAALAEHFRGGTYATFYLSPRDYHRIHIPITGTLQRTLYVPGRLFAVNLPTIRIIDAVFAKNERLINLFTTAAGTMAIVMVGALFVSSLSTTWSGEIPPGNTLIDLDYQNGDQNIVLKQGEEMGYFNMGSTVVLLFTRNAIQLSPHIAPDQPVIMGEKIATVL